MQSSIVMMSIFKVLENELRRICLRNQLLSLQTIQLWKTLFMLAILHFFVDGLVDIVQLDSQV